MDPKYKELVFRTLETTKITKLDEVLNRKFPEEKWVCEIDTNGRKPWIKVTDKWPSQYLCVIKDRVFYTVYRVVDDNAVSVFKDKLDRLERELMEE